MKKNLSYLFLLLLTFLLYTCSNLDPNRNTESTQSSEPEKNIQSSRNRIASVCTENLKNITLGVDTTSLLKGKTGMNVNLVWDAIDSAATYTIAIEPGGQRYSVDAGKTSLTAATNLKLDESFSASLTTTMKNGTTCGPIVYRATYCNGGGTVDDVYRTVDWDNICNNSSCDFLRFRSRRIEDCNGDLVNPLPWKLRGGTYYKRADVCDCLTNRGTMSICDGVRDLRLNPCLESLEKCLKHDYRACGE